MKMHMEKKAGDYEWIDCNGLKFRIKKTDEEMSVVWINKAGADLGFSLLFYDFLDHCKQELKLYLTIDSSWLWLKGFKVRNSDISFLLEEIFHFIKEWTIEPDLNDKIVNEEEWYSDT